jgi:regulator of protease activity HflC (stomatin/prohibitin superfamily)
MIDLAVMGFWGFIFLLLIYKFIKSICLVPTQSAYVVETFGRYSKTLGPGFHALIPFVDRVAFIQNLKEMTIDVPPQTCFSRDEVKVEVDGVLYITVVDPSKASYGITDYAYASMELAQTTTRSVIGTLDLDKTFEEREFISAKVVEVLEKAGMTWGIRVHRYEIRNITPPDTVRLAMEKQVTAERELRAILAKSEGDKQSTINVSEGEKTEMINHSEGEMIKMTNEAEGSAQEILELAGATAESIRKIAGAVSLEHGEEAIKLRLMEKYIGTIKNLADAETRVIIPSNIVDFDGWMRTVGLELPAAKK